MPMNVSVCLLQNDDDSLGCFFFNFILSNWNRGIIDNGLIEVKGSIRPVLP